MTEEAELVKQLRTIVADGDARGTGAQWPTSIHVRQHLEQAANLIEQQAATIARISGVDKVLSDGLPFGYDPATGFFHEDDGGAPASTIFYSPDERRSALIRAQTEPGWKPTHRHVKRGSEYMLLGIGKMQSEHWRDGSINRIRSAIRCNAPDQTASIDMREVAIYVGEDGQHWVRPREEFEDGRFEALAASPEREG